MFNKIFKLAFALLLVVILFTNSSEAQTKKLTYPIIYISPLIGVQFPIMGLNDNYKPSWNGGLDVALKINRETAFFINGSYYNMPKNTDAVALSDASYIGITAGPRYVFTSPKIKAQGFLEAGAGVFIFNQKEYTIPSPSLSQPDIIVPSSSNTLFGVTTGAGVFIPLSTSFDIIMKTILNYTFPSDGAGGSRTFLSARIGIDFKL
jgi:hypothetical protein